MDIYEKKAQMRKERQEQEALRDKYGITEEKVVIKETSNTGKFLIRLWVNFVRIICVILLLILAAIGIITLIYPENRQLFIDTLYAAFDGIV